jgi:hypothetical protein
LKNRSKILPMLAKPTAICLFLEFNIFHINGEYYKPGVKYVERMFPYLDKVNMRLIFVSLAYFSSHLVMCGRKYTQFLKPYVLWNTGRWTSRKSAIPSYSILVH